MYNIDKLTAPQKRILASVAEADRDGKSLTLFTTSDRKVAERLEIRRISRSTCSRLVQLERRRAWRKGRGWS